MASRQLFESRLVHSAEIGAVFPSRSRMTTRYCITSVHEKPGLYRHQGGTRNTLKGETQTIWKRAWGWKLEEKFDKNVAETSIWTSYHLDKDFVWAGFAPRNVRSNYPFLFGNLDIVRKTWRLYATSRTLPNSLQIGFFFSSSISVATALLLWAS